jgi:large subunit ribosomal protein L25
MSTIEKIEASERTDTGSTASRRLRTEGIVPANLYGHKKGAVSIQLSGEVAHHLLKDGARVVDLELNGEIEKALLKDVQWDTFSKHIMHIDFLRVDPNERVQVEVALVTKGTSPGVLEGGILDQQLHALEVECLAVEIPDSIIVRIGKLKIGDSFHVSDLTDLPKGLEVITAPDIVIASVIEERAAEPSEGDESATAEPEVINQSGGDEG